MTQGEKYPTSPNHLSNAELAIYAEITGSLINRQELVMPAVFMPAASNEDTKPEEFGDRIIANNLPRSEEFFGRTYSATNILSGSAEFRNLISRHQGVAVDTDKLTNLQRAGQEPWELNNIQPVDMLLGVGAFKAAKDNKKRSYRFKADMVTGEASYKLHGGWGLKKIISQRYHGADAWKRILPHIQDIGRAMEGYDPSTPPDENERTFIPPDILIGMSAAEIKKGFEQMYRDEGDHK